MSMSQAGDKARAMCGCEACIPTAMDALEVPCTLHNAAAGIACEGSMVMRSCLWREGRAKRPKSCFAKDFLMTMLSPEGQAAAAREGKSVTAVATAIQRTAEVIELRVGYDYAVFTIDQQAERSYFGLGIESSYGGYSYAWSVPGCDFRHFLARLNLDYVLSKMVGRDEEFDGEATVKDIRADIVRMRRAREITAEVARYEWPSSEFEHVGEFHDWCQGTKVFSDGSHEYYRSAPGQRAREFTALYEKFWPALAKELLS